MDGTGNKGKEEGGWKKCREESKEAVMEKWNWGVRG